MILAETELEFIKVGPICRDLEHICSRGGISDLGNLVADEAMRRRQ